MRVVITIQHPGHVHFFKHVVDELETRGHEVHVFARENEMAVDLLDVYGIDHEVLAPEYGSLPSLAAVQATYELRLLRRARRLDPDVVAAIGGVAASHVASVVGARSVVFYDTEHATLIQRLAYPFADVVCTPDCFTREVAAEHVRYPGYHELAYLHPDRFTPDESVRAEVGAGGNEPLVVARVSSWNSSHDRGEGGFDDVAEVVRRLEAAGARVVLTSETDLPADLERCRLSLAPERLHDLLYAADLTVGEGATTAAESAVLGTPAVYVNTQSMGYTTELESRYGLLFQFDGPERHRRGLAKAVSLLDTDDRRWRRRRETVLEEKCDTTTSAVRQIEAAG